MINKDLKLKILEISYKYNLTHIGSCLYTVDLINDIFKRRQPEDKIILSAGHAGLALYVVMEANNLGDAEGMLVSGGIHPDKPSQQNIDCSSGSLGHGIGIGIGMALANPNIKVHVIVSDGELNEGSCWEALDNIRRLGVRNILIHVVINGMGAYMRIDRKFLKKKLELYDKVADFEYDVTGQDMKDWEYVKIYEIDISEDFPLLKGFDGHYKTLDEQEIVYLREFLKSDMI
jgi:transketolase